MRLDLALPPCEYLQGEGLVAKITIDSLEEGIDAGAFYERGGSVMVENVDAFKENGSGIGEWIDGSWE